MKRQIFKSICTATIIVFIASLSLIMGVLYNYFSSVEMKGLETQTYIAASATELQGEDYLKLIANKDYRITWIAPDGSVLFDNKANRTQMENHLEREEIKAALEGGRGQSTRYSTTLTKKQLYFAQRLSDGSVLRLSATHLSWWALIFSMPLPIAIVIGIALFLSVFLAYRLAKRIVQPLNDLDLEAPNTERTYEELSPILNRIINQKKQLSLQANELKQKKEEFDTATRNMREGIVLLGKHGNILSINPSASRILKLSSYCVGKDLLLFNNTFEIQELLQVAVNSEHSEKTVAIDGKNYQFNASPIVTDGEVSGIALIIFDITEKERAETTRREFTANVSHELKTPLQNISGYAELLARGLVKPEDVISFSSNIYSESKRMIDLIEDIIKLSHLDESSNSYEFDETDLYELASITHQTLLPVAKNKGIDFSLEGDTVYINGIPGLISEIMYNLCDNAIKYNKKGGWVKMIVRQEKSNAILEVQDNGIGIPPEEQERIFERFYRVDKSRSKEVGGTGLGLSIVKHAALVHNAKVAVKSTLGYGTTFSITFTKGGE